MKSIILVGLLFCAYQANATIGFYAGGRQGSIDSNTLPTTYGITYSSTAQTGYEGGLFYEYFLNDWFGARAGASVVQVAANTTVKGAISGSATSNATDFAIPVSLEFNLGPYLTLMLGGFYWTNNSISCTYTGAFVGANCSAAQGSGFGPRGGLGINISKNFEIDLAYEPSVQVSPGSNGNPAETLTSYAGDIVIKF